MDKEINMAFEIMKPIDNFINSQVNNLKQNQNYLNFLEDFSNKDENIQTIYKGIISFLIFMIPVSILLISFLFNYSLQSKLDETEDIISTGMRIIEKKSTINTEAKNFFGTPLSSRSSLQNTINNALSSAGVASNKVTIQNFQPDTEKGYNIVTIDLKFGGFSNKNLFTFLSGLNTRNKMRIEEINIKKNLKSNLLEGVITFIHYSKNSDRNL